MFYSDYCRPIPTRLLPSPVRVAHTPRPLQSVAGTNQGDYLKTQYGGQKDNVPVEDLEKNK